MLLSFCPETNVYANFDQLKFMPANQIGSRQPCDSERLSLEFEQSGLEI